MCEFVTDSLTERTQSNLLRLTQILLWGPDLFFPLTIYILNGSHPSNSKCWRLKACGSTYFSLGGSLWEREPDMVSPLLITVTLEGGCVPSPGPVLEDGAWDLERSSFLSRLASPPVVGSFEEVSRLPDRAPDPENHPPDLVRISCCLRHRLHTHITCRG